MVISLWRQHKSVNGNVDSYDWSWFYKPHIRSFWHSDIATFLRRAISSNSQVWWMRNYCKTNRSHFARAVHSHHPSSVDIEWSLLQQTSYIALSVGTKTPKIASSPWDFVTLPEKDRATAIGNKHKKLLKIARMTPEICWRTDRQTDVLFTILRHRSRGRSKSKKVNRSMFTNLKELIQWRQLSNGTDLSPNSAVTLVTIASESFTAAAVGNTGTGWRTQCLQTLPLCKYIE